MILLFALLTILTFSLALALIGIILFILGEIIKKE